MAEPGFGQLAQGAPAGMAPNPNATPEQQEQYRAGWMDVLSRPEVRAGLLQFGMSMMGDKPIQQSGGGAFAGALGAGAGAYDTSIKAQAAGAQQDTENLRAQQQLDVQRSQVGATLAGQENQAAISAAGDAAAMARVNRQGELERELKMLPPSAQAEANDIAAKLIANPPVSHLNDPDWATTAGEIAIKQVQSSRAAFPTTPTGEVPVTKVPSVSIDPATGQERKAPPLPENLVGKFAGWDYRRQLWVLPDGSVKNRQGVDVPTQ